MVEYWNDQYLIGNETIDLPDLMSNALYEKAQKEESHRVDYGCIEKPLNLKKMVDLLKSEETWDNYIDQAKPSCLVILNTVQSAAVIADALSRELNDRDNSLCKKAVIHLSTALTPKDREIILDEINRRQGDSEWNDQTWYLIATSCIEAGVDLDFAIGFREKCSVTSFLQVAGRINRHGRRLTGSLKSFSIVPEDGLNHHPGFKQSSIVFDDLWDQIIDPNCTISTLSTTAIRKQFSREMQGMKYSDLKLNKREYSEEILKDEENSNFQRVAENYNVISSDTVTVITDLKLVKKLERGIPVDWQYIQNNSVQLWMSKIENLKLNAITTKDNIYSWVDTYTYDPSFLGIMGGLIETKHFFVKEGGVL